MLSPLSIRRSGILCRGLSLMMVSLATAMLTSCNSGPARVQQAYIDASAAGAAAMDQYDTNGDGAVAGDELNNAPGLKSAMANLDQDGDRRITAEEVAERVRAWQEQKTGITNVRCVVLMDGRPLTGAEVVFEPEKFLGDAIETAVGTVGSSGSASPIIPKEQRPTPQTPPGLRLGLYKVRVSKTAGGRELVPARYNTETTLGQEVSADAPGMNRNHIEFKLKSS